jgi:signal transduction histidine kinase
MRSNGAFSSSGLIGLPLFLLALAVRPGSREDAEGGDRDQIWEILDRLGEGVVLVADDLRPVLANSAARSMLGFRPDALPPRVPSEDIVRLAAEALDQARERGATLDLWFPARSTLEVRVVPLESGGAVIALRDVTEEQLAQRVRKEFVAHASHELKSPVASLQALAEAIGQAVEDDPASAARFAERMAAESERLGRLVSDLLDLSRLEDPTRASEDPVDLSAAAGDEVRASRVDAQAKNIKLVSHIDAGIWVRGDEQQIGLMIRNLLDNAIRYTSEGGEVEIVVTAGRESAELRVADNGIGIPRESQARVFERFYRVDRARSRGRGGTGLGLAIVKHVAELHGGTVTVTSDLGQGSTFAVRLPLLVGTAASEAG